MNLEQLHKIYFLGIGGIGMSALARYFMACGIQVFGYDKTQTDLTKQLVEQGAKIHYKDDINNIAEDIDLVIYTPAIPIVLSEYQFLLKQDIIMLKRSEVLGELTKDKFTIAVAGTHGKTTISSMIAHCFNSANISFAALIGGISTNYNTNFIGNPNADVFIVEADEFDRSFLTLKPDIAVISSIDADHLDVYGDKNAVKESFQLFADQISANGNLILKSGLTIDSDKIKQWSYDLDSKADFYAKSIKVENESYILNLCAKDQAVSVKMNYPGKHNLENSIAAYAACQLYGIESEIIVNALENYSGVKRRFEIIIKTEQLVYIDDYAHHPKELSACISAVKEIYPECRISGIFQPHLYSRTRDFVDEFARSLEMLDEIIIMDIYPAREAPIEGINANFLLSKIQHQHKMYLSKSEILSWVKNQKFEVLLTLGAGDIDQFVEPIKKALSV